MAKPSRRLGAKPYTLHVNLRDVVLAGVVRRVLTPVETSSSCVGRGKLKKNPILCLELSWQKKAISSSPTSQATPNS